ncbi:MAG: DUF309 domain-containing protein [Synechococcus sp.]|uniref:DUF309 domain-containing protein n=1 Tax=Synechococcus sp. BMK-MC-1 TaxID=1442551 RepID=UPI001646F1AA|nr:DUF309 domain-containing protein [Synechococcus sp. BMK-MC-1]QNI67672.1 conserved hypothetical protein (DUF309) [Synechococcus sp. BMK-MC-1]
MNLLDDPRFSKALELFNSGAWYEAHDAFEELWHEQVDPNRRLLQGILQIAVAHVHLERGNTRGATILLGEGIGRLKPSLPSALGLDLQALHTASSDRLNALQNDGNPDDDPPPKLIHTNDAVGS